MAQKQIERLERRALAEKQKVLKPGECNKYITVLIDPSCISSEVLGTEIPSALTSSGFNILVEQQKHTRVILFRRTNPQTLKSSTDLELTSKYTIEPHLIYLMPALDLINHVNLNTLTTQITQLQDLFPKFTIHLQICGLKTHCKVNRGCLNRTQTEFALTEIQLNLNCSHRLLESSEEVATTISQFAKSVAEEPFKKQKMEKFEHETFYLGNDSKDCVSIQNGIGLSRLWQQQLTKMPQVTLEVAEAITSKYPMPRLLMEELEQSDEPEKVLENLTIRRGGHASNRRVGPELSKKVCNLMLKDEPNFVI